MKKLQIWTIQWWIIQSVLIWKANGNANSNLGDIMAPPIEINQGKICSKVRKLENITLKNMLGTLEFEQIYMSLCTLGTNAERSVILTVIKPSPD